MIHFFEHVNPFLITIALYYRQPPGTRRDASFTGGCLIKGMHLGHTFWIRHGSNGIV
jgi:hypothetical protein